jgi:molybdate transport system substrate-binding protein
MRAFRPTVFVATAALLAAGVAACGSDDDGGSDATVAATAAAASVPTAPLVEGDITVFAAASLTSAFEEIGEAFEAANPEADVTFNFASSSDLVTQINEGAPADVFASADANNMTKLTDAGGAAGAPIVFATNVAEIIVAPGNPTSIAEVADLSDPDLIVVQCAPEVPCGAYAEQIYANAGITVTPKSLEENVKAVVAKVTLGEADAGIVYATDVIAAGDEASGVKIPTDVNVVAEYPIAATAEAPNPGGAAQFIEFVMSPEGQQILSARGFLPPAN